MSKNKGGRAVAHRVISLRAPRMLAVQDLRDSIQAGNGPRTSGEFLAMLAERLIHRMGPVLETLGDTVDEIEQDVIDHQSREIRSRLGMLRRQAILLRRYIAPQRDVIARLANERLAWMADADRAHLRETADRITRYVEDLDVIRDRAAVTQEELANRLSDQMNRTMYRLSLVATVFLPLGFLTGLLGINVAGIPGSENQSAFILVCVILVAIAGIELVFFYLRRWL